VNRFSDYVNSFMHTAHIYTWSTREAKWVDVNDIDWDEVQARQAEAETELLEYWKIDEAISLLQKILKTEAYDKAYCMYLLGLAYELKDNEKMAVETDLNLW
jgi:hypothetical protein